MKYLTHKTPVKLGKRLLRKLGLLPRSKPLRDIHKELPWVSEEPFGTPQLVSSVRPNSLTWFVPPLGKGSGGHLNIFRFIRMLEEQGFESRIVICHEHRRVTNEQAKKEIEEWFFPLRAKVMLHPGNEIPASHFAIATGWQTAYVVRAFQSCKRRLYFVQDFEPWFYGASAPSKFAEATYRFGFTAITAGNWLAELLARDYGMKTYPVGFGVDHQLFSPQPRPAQQGKHVFFYARPPTARRGFELGLLALEQLSQRIPDLTVHLAGWPMTKYHLPFRHVDHGILPLEQLAALYSRCDAALVFSFSNLSLLPLEIMACGCPVVSNDGPNVEWLLDDDNSLLVHPTVESVSDGLASVLTNGGLREKLIAQGLAASSRSEWASQGTALARILNQLISP